MRQLRVIDLKVAIRILPVAAALLAFSGSTERPQAFTVTIVSEFGGYAASDERLLLMDEPQGHYPTAPHFLDVAVTPPLEREPDVAWGVSHGIDVEPVPESGFEKPPLPAGVAIYRENNFVGPFIITGTLGAPIDKQIMIPGFAYETIGLGCTSGFAGGYKIDPRGTPHETDTARDADIYLTAPIVPELILWNRCSADFRRGVQAKSMLVVPGGAIDLSDGRATFPNVSGDRWKGDVARAFDPRAVHGTLLWRTRDGRLMKTLQGLGGSDNVIGQTIMAGVDGRFADNDWLQSATPEQRAVGDSALTSLQYTTTIADYGLFTSENGPPHPLEFLPYRGGASSGDNAPIVCLHTNPQVYPTPTATWSLRKNRDSVPAQTPTLTTIAEVPSPACRRLGGLRPGSFTITVSVGAPVSQQVSRRAVVYNPLFLRANAAKTGIRFVGNRPEYVADRSSSDLFFSTDGVLHFPGGGILLTSGIDPSLGVPKMARAGSAFSLLAADAWRNDRTMLDAADWQRAGQPCRVTKPSGNQVNESPCDVMPADLLLFRTRLGRYVKLHIFNFSDASLGAAFEVIEGGWDSP